MFAESLQNFIDWSDSITLMHSGACCLVSDLNGNRQHGSFHQMREAEHNAFKAHLSHFVTWGVHCNVANLSAGKYYVIAPSERETMQITHKKLGPFQ